VRYTMKQKLVATVSGVVVLAGGGVAYAATQASSSRQAFLGDVANRLSVSPSRLDAALSGAFRDRLAAAVAAGKLTQDQANAIEQRVQQNGGVPGFGGGWRDGWHGEGLRGKLTAAGQYLGLTKAQLESDLQSGKSLAQIASSERGKSARGLKQAITNAATVELNAAVAANRITKAQEQQLLANLANRIDALLQRTDLRSGHGWFGHGATAGATTRF
jgi:hypothetical protein